MNQNIAHIVTLTSMLTAIISIIQSFNLQFSIAAYFILICFFLDGIDGAIARRLNTTSNFGKELDSFSDFIAFGIAPGFLMYNFMNYELNYSIICYLAFIIPIFSAIRLAHYNTSKYKKNFIGLTTPVSALFFSAIPLINLSEKNDVFHQIIINPYTITISIIIISILLISKLPTFSIRIDSLKYDKRKMMFIFISMLILFIFNFTGILAIIILYIILNRLRTIN
ncbi:MAG: CDP-diacylglycerol--serine O-phosphatidyltransferase [Flavobacteriales bacterium]|nr:CDP-diacylglycerol--serine O-phosphatidyltransferase [Flavobacteriales bacterium]